MLISDPKVNDLPNSFLNITFGYNFLTEAFWGSLILQTVSAWPKRHFSRDDVKGIHIAFKHTSRKCLKIVLISKILHYSETDTVTGG